MIMASSWHHQHGFGIFESTYGASLKNAVRAEPSDQGGSAREKDFTVGLHGEVCQRTALTNHHDAVLSKARVHSTVLPETSHDDFELDGRTRLRRQTTAVRSFPGCTDDDAAVGLESQVCYSIVTLEARTFKRGVQGSVLGCSG